MGYDEVKKQLGQILGEPRVESGLAPLLSSVMIDHISQLISKPDLSQVLQLNPKLAAHRVPTSIELHSFLDYLNRQSESGLQNIIKVLEKVGKKVNDLGKNHVQNPSENGIAQPNYIKENLDALLKIVTDLHGKKLKEKEEKTKFISEIIELQLDLQKVLEHKTKEENHKSVAQTITRHDEPPSSDPWRNAYASATPKGAKQAKKNSLSDLHKLMDQLAAAKKSFLDREKVDLQQIKRDLKQILLQVVTTSKNNRHVKNQMVPSIWSKAADLSIPSRIAKKTEKILKKHFVGIEASPERENSLAKQAEAASERKFEREENERPNISQHRMKKS